MNPKSLLSVLAVAGLCAMALFPRVSVRAGEVPRNSAYRVLDPIRHGNLTVFPVVAATSHDTRDFLTLDEGIRSGEVVVSEYGSIQPLVRGRGILPARGGPQVNELVLVNNSKKPLLLLAGEIVTGGKQDRVIGKDRLVPAESDPIDLSVFCVEPGRWTGASATFGSAGGVMGGTMAQPAVRGKAMGAKNQAQVWDEVRKQQSEMVAKVPAPAAPSVAGTTSYARVMSAPAVTQQVNSLAVPVEREYHSLVQQLRDRNAVGVVVAVNGEIIWADVFASTNLLEKYWPKLVRSYAAEAIAGTARAASVDVKPAQQFLDNVDGRRETVESEPGLYRHTEITGDGFKAFELTSLLPKTGFDLHLAKMAN